MGRDVDMPVVFFGVMAALTGMWMMGQGAMDERRDVDP